jgi:CelD/BcsL family acetyltransferase involved in cellulose biosynthesis
LIPGKLPSHRELAFIGANEIAPDHLDFIIRNGHEEKVLPAILKYIQSDRTWDILRLEALASNSSLANYLLKRVNSLGTHVDQAKGYILHLPDSWQKYHSDLGKNLRKNLKRYSRQLENDYPKQVSLSHASNEHEIKDALQFLFKQASNNIQEQGKQYSLSVKKLQDFHYKVVRLLNLQNWVRVYLMVVGEEYISVLYCFRYNNTISDYQTTFKSSWKNYRPGQIILAHSIEQAIKEKMQVYDFLRGEHPYLDQWTNETTIDYYIKMGNTLKGRMLVFLYTVLQVRFWIYDLRDKFLKWASTS